LEGSGTVGHSKEHHKGFKEAVIGTKGCLPFISRLDSYVIETPSDVKLCEVLGSAELGDKFRDEGEGVPVLDGVMPDSCLGNKNDIFHHNNKNNQLERRVWPPKDIH